jgi:hypothetical protein
VEYYNDNGFVINIVFNLEGNNGNQSINMWWW